MECSMYVYYPTECQNPNKKQTDFSLDIKNIVKFYNIFPFFGNIQFKKDSKSSIENIVIAEKWKKIFMTIHELTTNKLKFFG